MEKDYIRLQETFGALDRLWEADEQLGAEADKEPAKEQSTADQSSITSTSENPAKMMDELATADDYKTFVAILAKDQKSQAFINFLSKHYKTGDDTLGTLKQAQASKKIFKCNQLEVTQNNISLSKSLEGPLEKPAWLEKILNEPTKAFDDPLIVYADKYIIDGHHRWSKIYALNSPMAEVEAINFAAVEGVSWKDVLKAVQITNVINNPNYPLVNKVGEDNMLKSSVEDITKFVTPLITSQVIDQYKKFSNNELATTQKVANYIAVNGNKMKNTCGAFADKPPREVMPQTDKAPGSVETLVNDGILDMTEAFNLLDTLN